MAIDIFTDYKKENTQQRVHYCIEYACHIYLKNQTFQDRNRQRLSYLFRTSVLRHNW